MFDLDLIYLLDNINIISEKKDKNKDKDIMKLNEKSISNFLNEENKEYSLYVLKKRAIPSLIDGLKTTQRKILDTAQELWNTNNSFKKVFQLAGIVADKKEYHHSNTSLEDTIIGMGQYFKNNLVLLDTEGQWGFLRIPEAGAARYISCKLNTELYNKIFKDYDLTIEQYVDGNKVEPKYLLPIIPMVLINGSQGIAVGFASKIFNREPKRIIEACIKYLNKESFNDSFKPYIKDFNGKLERDKNNILKWNFYGIFEKINSTTIKIKEYTPFKTYEKIIDHLNSLEDKIIISYENNSTKTLDITVKFKKEDLQNYTDEDISKILGLDSSETENLTLLDENDNIKIFNNIKDIIIYFVDFRLKLYKIRKENIIKKLNKDYDINYNKFQFIDLIIKQKIIINKKSKEDIIKQIEKHKLLKIDDNYNYLLNMPLYSLTKEKLEELHSKIKNIEKEIKYIKNISEKDMYLNDLNELLKNI